MVLGYFGYRTNQLDGQTVKTRDLYRLISEKKGKIDYYDSQEFQYRRLSIFTMFAKIGRCRTLVYLPAHNNLNNIFPIIFVLTLFFRIDIHYFVIGGWLREFLKNKPVHRFMLRHISGIHAETKQMKHELEQYYHFNNVDVFPNFRFFDFIPKSNYNSEVLSLVFMARINRMKGLDMIFVLGDYIVSNHWEQKVTITFYGPIFDEDKEYFEGNVSKYSFMNYQGVLQPELIHQTLQRYDAMLLPTHYYTEGLPGSVVDAYIAGIPVVVTDWKHAREFVEHHSTGIVVPFNRGQSELNEAISLLFNDKQLLLEMKVNAHKKSKDFSSGAAWSKLKKFIDN